MSGTLQDRLCSWSEEQPEYRTWGAGVGTQPGLLFIIYGKAGKSSGVLMPVVLDFSFLLFVLPCYVCAGCVAVICPFSLLWKSMMPLFLYPTLLCMDLNCL